MPKDRLGLVVAKQGDEFGVTFVSPGSPAEAAGFAKGDQIAALDGKPAAVYPDLAIINLHIADIHQTLAPVDMRGAYQNL